jgi:two-component system, chemotaxis family, sensor kinase CheA
MNEKDKEFFKKLLSTFRVEAEEHIRTLSSGLIDMEKTPEGQRRMEIIEIVFREAHSLKGAARSVNMSAIEAVCQALESIFSTLKRRDIGLSPDLFDILHKAVDSLNSLLLSSDAEPSASDKTLVKKLLQQLDSVSKGELPLSQKPGSEDLERETPATPEQEARRPSTEGKSVTADTIRIATEKLDSIMLQAEELLSAKLTANQRTSELQAINTSLSEWNKEIAKHRVTDVGIRNENVKSRQAAFPGQQMNEFLDWNIEQIKSLEDRLSALTKSAEHDSRALGGMVDDLLNDVKMALMHPFSSLLEILPKVVRDLSHDRGNKVDLVIQGGDTEIDRRILEEMKDPIIHLVRNSVDHGIEKSEERSTRKKPMAGTLAITISQVNSSKVEILISDDGAGIDVEKVRESGIKAGIVSRGEADGLDEQEVLSLIFKSGVSTSPIITDISGRGLGLAIVKEKVEKIGGVISCDSKAETGTTFKIVLPLTVATYRGVLIRMDEHTFVLPTKHIDCTKRIRRDEIKTVENRETISMNGRIISLADLHTLLELPKKGEKSEAADFIQVVVLAAGEKSIALSVDEVLHEQEVLVKNLGGQLSRVRNVAGAAVLGTGKVVPILNVPDLIKTAVKFSSAPAEAVMSVEEGIGKKHLLIVEDSITARTLLKNILETAGYAVKTAVDGVDALTTLRTADFDLVVSDVDMPRMNGFDLTAKIRSNRKLADLPVVLVTALESREDRERGIDAGANAYIVKSSFDQSNLLETIKRII